MAGFSIPTAIMSTSNAGFHWPPDTGLLLVGHGSREPTGVREFLATTGLVAGMAAQLTVEPCFLEFAEPAIADGFRTLVRRGARRIVVVPVLLFSAGHAKRDIPAAVAAAAAGETSVNVLESDHLGCHEAILELSRLRYDQAIAEHAAAGDDETVLVMVGRGSHDRQATAEMRRFVELRGRAARVPRARACFVAMAEPRLADVLDEAALCGVKQIVVEPHLLFGGVLVDRVRRTVAEYAGRYPRIRWVTTGHLGPSELVARAILCRARETLSRSEA